MKGTRTRSSPALMRALAHLKSAVISSRAQGNWFLPGVRRLAFDCGCSQTTMTAAIARLARAGILTTGRRIFILPSAVRFPDTMPEDNACAVSAPMTRGRQLAAALRTDLTAVRFAAGTALPSVKELCERYGTSYAPMKHALDALATDGLLARHKRGFRTIAPGRATPGSTIKLIWPD